MSKRIVYSEYGTPDVLRFEDGPLPVPGPGRVLVRTEMIGVNPIDWKLVAGAFARVDPAPFPGTPGWAATGIIEALGDGVTDYAIGQAVILDSRARLPVTSGSRGGTFAEHVTVDTTRIVPRPEGVSIEQAASLPSSAVAGYSMIQNLGITSEDILLVHGAAGSVGSATVQIAIDFRGVLLRVSVWVLVAHLPSGRRHRGRTHFYTRRRRSCGPDWLGQPGVRDTRGLACPADPFARGRAWSLAQ